MVAINNASSAIQWQVIRKNSCFLRRQRGIPKLFSTEPFNPRKVNSPRFNGLINPKAVDVQPAKNGKGVTVTLKKKSSVATPATSTVAIQLNKGSRHTIATVKKLVKGYKPSQVGAASQRASQILRSQKTTKPKKGAAARKANKTEA